MSKFVSNINLEGEVILKDLAAWMDGGTITMSCEDDKNQAFEIEIIQHMIIEKNIVRDQDAKIPGRIYLNKIIVEPRSELENKILCCLRNIIKTSSIGSLDCKIIEKDINYIVSSEYLTHWEKTKKWQT